MKNSKKLLITISLAVVLSLVLIGFGSLIFKTKNNLQTQSIKVSPVCSQILATGEVASQNEAQLHFQAGGKLTYLPFKEGDRVYAGQTIASLDTYNLQEQLRSALNTYRSTRDKFDQAQNDQNNGVTQKSQGGTLNAVGAGLGQYGVENTTTNYLDTIAKRIVDENQANLDNSVINVEIANYALTLSSITSPINGVITHEDVTTSGVNVTTATTFIVDDPSNLVFKANVSENDIDFINVGSVASIEFGDGNGYVINGTVDKIYPQKQTLADGSEVYQVDIVSNQLPANIQLGQSGSVLIQSNVKSSVILVPTWTILGHQYIWVVNDNKPILRKVTVGKIHGSE